MRNGKILISAVALFAAASCLQITSQVFAQDRYAGTTIMAGHCLLIGGRSAGRSAPFTLIVKRMTTPEEVTQLNAALQSGGQEALLKALSRLEAGSILLAPALVFPRMRLSPAKKRDVPS